MPPQPATPIRLWPPDEAQLAKLFERGRLQRARALQDRIVEIQADAQGASARVRGAGQLRDEIYELALQGVADLAGAPHYSALCSCRAQRFCEHAAAVLLKLHADAEAPRREAALAAWTAALRRKAGKDELARLPKLSPADAALLMDRLQGAELAPAPAPAMPLRAAEPSPPAGERAVFRPRLRLRTLSRGDGLLGLARRGKLGPRGDQVTVAQVDWVYAFGDGETVEIAAPRSLLNSRPPLNQLAGERLLARNLAAEAEARDQLWASGLAPLEAELLQWRAPALGESPAFRALWTLNQEEFFGPFWEVEVPKLEAAGWKVEALPGFAHRPVAAERFTLKIDKLALPERQGNWLVSLGLEIDGETLDLAPMVADLMRRDARWYDAVAIAAIDDDAVILLHAPGGRRIEAPAATLKAVIGAMVDLLLDPKRPDGPLVLSDWDATRLLNFDDGRARWEIHGDADLRGLARRLLAAGAPTPVAVPAGLGVELRPYQRAGLAWLQYLRAQKLAGILADDMGLGKTAQTLAHLLVEKQAGRLGGNGENGGPALAVLPTSLLFNWSAEAARIAPDLRVLVLQGPERARDFGRIGDFDLVLTSYPLVWRDIEALAGKTWHLLIIDEAQTVKNAASLAAKALRRIKARHRLALTGTPLENNLGELWAQFDFLMPGFLGDARGFERRWRKPIEVNGESLRAQVLAQRVRPFILRRRKEDVATELPALTTVTRKVELYGEQRELYESVRVAADTQVRRVLARRGFAGAQISVLDALLKLRQVCCDPRLVKGVDLGPGMGRAKLELLAEMLPELVAEGRTVLVFSQFAEMLALIEEELARLALPHLVLTGATPVARRGEIVAAFQAGTVPVMLVSLKAGGTGLNLTAADTVIHADPWWNPAVEEQASARAHRIGQDRPVFVYRLVVAGSIEERMLELQARKLALADAVLGADAAEPAKFTAEDLELLLAPLP